MKKTWIVQLKKGCRIFLVCTLILGILAGSFGISAIAVQTVKEKIDEKNAPAQDEEEAVAFTYESPLDSFDEAANEITLNDNVRVLTEAESNTITDAIVNVESKSDYNHNYFEVELDGNRNEFSDKLVANQIIYLDGDKTSPFGEDGRFFKIDRVNAYSDKTYLSLSEPYVNEVFDTLDIAISESLTEENFVSATFMDGVSAYFAEEDVPAVDTELSNIETVQYTGDLNMDKTESNNTQIQTLSLHTGDTPSVQKVIKNNGPSVEYEEGEDNAGIKFSVKEGDLIVKLDIQFGDDKDKDEAKKKQEEEKSKDDKSKAFSTSVGFGIQGEVGIRNIETHYVVDKVSDTKYNELYYGLSGEMFVDTHFYGKLTGSAKPEISEKDLLLIKLEGLNEKRFPIAVFQFHGLTPVYITNKQFDAQKGSLLPRLYLILYADWEGNISLEVNAGFEYSYGFNHGVHVFNEGKWNPTFKEFPYASAYSVESKDDINWYVTATLEAHTDLTVLGGGVLFYLAGINLGDITLFRSGIEADGKVSFRADNNEATPMWDSSIYLRAYLKLIEVKVRLKIDGEYFLDNLDEEFSFTAVLFDFDLVRFGTQPEKFRPDNPISTKPVPEEFRSVITLVCDVSGSMNSYIDTGETKLAAAKEAAKTIVDTTASWAANYEDNYGIGVVMFSDTAQSVTIPHVDYPYIKDCIDTIGNGGGTCIYSGIDVGIMQLQSVKSPNKVMILMTDGQDSAESESLESARAAAAEGITIFTIGFGDDVDEELLQEIAAIAGGEYRFSNTDNSIGIVSNFMYAQQSGVAEVLAETEGTVSEGETTKPITIEIEDSNGDLVIYTLWPGSFLDTILIDPNGREVDENYPGATIDKSTIPTTIIVKNPIPGKWKSKIVGVETSYDNEPYYSIVSFIETDGAKVNEPISNLQTAAAYCIAIGFSTALISLLLLICLSKKKDNV